MTKRLVTNADAGAVCHEEPYYPELGPSGGLRWYVTLSDGRRMPWGNNMAHAWRLAHKRLLAERQAAINLADDIARLEKRHA